MQAERDEERDSEADSEEEEIDDNISEPEDLSVNGRDEPQDHG